MTFRPKRADAAIVRAIETWFASAARDLPWRVTPRDPYLSLVSEFMLQQTQVSRVLEKFGPFIRRFPSLDALAGAPESDVLAEWSGMGYYRRARLLHAAARAIRDEHASRIPKDATKLRDLPGIGRYTAGAIASIVFAQREPIVDGNVARVLLRIDGHDVPAPAGVDHAWERAAGLVQAATRIAHFNEGLMELGATVCTPRAPRCDVCPVNTLCRARAAGTQEEIPRPKKAPTRRPLHCSVVIVRDGERVLVEQRPGSGMWAGMWQAPTLEGERAPTRKALAAWIGSNSFESRGSFEHATTHRDVSFRVWEAKPPITLRGQWMSRAQIERLAISNPQRRILLPGLTDK